MTAPTVVNPQELEIGKTYAVDSRRKGKFTMRVTEIRLPFVDGIIVSGRATAMNPDNEREEGEEIGVRDSLTTFYMIAPEAEEETQP